MQPPPLYPFGMQTSLLHHESVQSKKLVQHIPQK